MEVSRPAVDILADRSGTDLTFLKCGAVNVPSRSGSADGARPVGVRVPVGERAYFGGRGARLVGMARLELKGCHDRAGP